MRIGREDVRGEAVTDARGLTRYGWLSVGVATAVLVLKGGAYAVTGSVGLLSDALESLTNVAGSIMALAMLSVAARPPDDEHAYGHTKAEYFSSGFEGALISVAAIGVFVVAAGRLLSPQPIQQPVIGLGIAAIASALNLVAARMLLRAGQTQGSITLEANARHLMTDVWTSAGVIIGVGASAATGWYRLDPLIALAVSGHIGFTGARLIGRSVMGLLDTALPPAERRRITEVLARHEAAGIAFHALRTRRAGRQRFISMHVLVPGDWTVQRGHELLERIEAEIRQAVPRSTVFTHLEPLEDPVSFRDTRLHRDEDAQRHGSTG